MLALDVLLLMMIVVCIVYCWILNQRIRDLHNSRVEFARMIKEFDAAVVKAESCISELSTLGANATLQIKNATMDAEELISELKTVNDFGNKLGGKLETSISDARQVIHDLESSVSSASESVSATKSKRKKAAVSKVSKHEISSSENEEFDYDEAGSKFKQKDNLVPEQRNLIEAVLSKITTHKHKGTLGQSDFYDSLRKVSANK